MQSNLDAIAFGKDDIDAILSKLSGRQIDELPFGAIQLDADGKVLRYNATEARHSGRTAAAVVGADYFREVAPCTNTARFKGVFDAGVRVKRLNTMFEYVFDYKTAPARTRVHMKHAEGDGSFWILVQAL